MTSHSSPGRLHPPTLSVPLERSAAAAIGQTRDPSRWRWFALALVVAPCLMLRLWLIRHAPEPDTDFAGHFGIAHALLRDPTNVAIHWVWLPAYHYLLAAWVWLGGTATGVRVVNCALATVVPAAVLLYGESPTDSPRRGLSAAAPWMAAVFCAVSPLVNLLGTSGQQETLFTLLVLGTVWAVDTRRSVLAGLFLAFASLVRYEAWGALALLAGLRVWGTIPVLRDRIPRWLVPSSRLPAAIMVPPFIAVGGWFVARRLREGEWFGFLRELYRYSHVQHDIIEHDWLRFPVQQPLFVFGWLILLLAAIGIHRSWRPSHVVALGIHLFLLGAYMFKGALGSARYYESLTPFVALAAAQGVCVVGARWRWLVPPLFALAAWQLATLSAQLVQWTWPSLDEASSISRDVDALSRTFRRIASPGGTASLEPSAREPTGSGYPSQVVAHARGGHDVSQL